MKKSRPTKLGHSTQQPLAPLANGASPLDQPKVECVNPDCDCKIFAGGIYIHKVSPILSASGKAEYVGETVSYCVKCHTPLPSTP